MNVTIKMTWMQYGSVTGEEQSIHRVINSSAESHLVMALRIASTSLARAYGVPPSRIEVHGEDGNQVMARWWDGAFRYGNGIMAIGSHQGDAMLVPVETCV